MPFDRKIFRDNDIRGIYPTDLDEGVMYKVGQALATKYKAKRVAVGRDMRVSGPSMQRALVDGFMSMGVRVYDLGMITTPINYFAGSLMKVDLACIVSSSHNPKEYNGLIIAKKNGAATTEAELEDIIRLSRAPTVLPGKRGSEQRKQIMGLWIDHVFGIISPKEIKPMKVVFDTGNGVEAVELEPALERLPQIKAIKMFFEPDGNFPNHIPNPLLSKTLVGLRKRVKKEKADVGFSYDGDGDRVIMVDEKGKAVEGSVMTAYLAKYFLEHRRYSVKPAMLYTSVMSRIVPEKIEEYGGRALKAPVGHSLIKAMMRQKHALFAGEHSGHFYFKDNYYADSALVGTLVLLAAISSDPRPLSEQLKEFRVYAKQEEISVKVQDRDEFIDGMRKALEGGKTTLGKPKKVTGGDGVTFDFEEFWFNLRPSGTEPVVRLNIEAYKADKLEGIVKKILSVVRRLDGDV